MVILPRFRSCGIPVAKSPLGLPYLSQLLGWYPVQSRDGKGGAGEGGEARFRINKVNFPKKSLAHLLFVKKIVFLQRLFVNKSV